jgi:hypothetical protein
MEQVLSIDTDLGLIVKIITERLDVDIFNRKRNNEIVCGRLICAKLLHEKGHTLKSIGRAMMRDHTTIIYYIRTLNALVIEESELKHKYYKCQDEFFKDSDFLLEQINRNHYKDEVYLLKKKIHNITRNSHKYEAFYDKYKRLEEIILLVNKNTDSGKEREVLKRINAMFNTIQK